MDDNKSWAEMFGRERERSSDDSPIEAWCAFERHHQYGEPAPDLLRGAGPPTGDWFTRSFDAGFGIEQGSEFTIWTARRVYFPACYDGSEWVASVSRHPDAEPTAHIGGG